MNRSHVLPILLISLASACGNDGEAEPPRDAAPAAQAASTGASIPAGLDEEMLEVADYRLSMDAVERWHEAQRTVYREARGNPELVRELSADLSEATLDDLEDHFASIPEVDDAIEDAGLEVREFVLIVLALSKATTAHEMIAMGMSEDTLMSQMGIHPADLRFARENRARLQEMQRETDALAPPELVDGADDY